MGLSIVVPVYNEAPFLRRCLDSIPIRDGIEVIVVDDGSTDGSSDICDEYEDVFNVIHSMHKGVSSARNIGIEFATQDYITFIDSDDEYLPGAIDIMLNNLNEEHCGIMQYNHNIIRKNVAVPRMRNKPGLYDINNRPRTWYCVWNKIFHKDIIGDIRFEEGMQYGEDSIFAIQCFVKSYSMLCFEEPTVLKHIDNLESLTRIVSNHDMKFYKDVFEDLCLNSEEYTDIYQSAMNERIKE